MQKIASFFLQIENKNYFCTALKNKNGLVVQLVRIHACHAWGREFESRPDRNLKQIRS